MLAKDTVCPLNSTVDKVIVLNKNVISERFIDHLERVKMGRNIIIKKFSTFPSEIQEL